jgi:hypothetical protein
MTSSLLLSSSSSLMLFCTNNKMNNRNLDENGHNVLNPKHDEINQEDCPVCRTTLKAIRHMYETDPENLDLERYESLHCAFGHYLSAQKIKESIGAVKPT